VLQQNYKAVYLPYYWLICCGPRQLSWYSYCPQIGRSLVWIPKVAKFSSTRPKRPWVHLTSYTRGTSSFPGESGRDVVLTTHSGLLPGLKTEQSYTSTPPMGLGGLSRVTCTFTFTSHVNLFAVSQPVQLYTIQFQLQSVTLTVPSAPDIYRWVERWKVTGAKYYCFVRKTSKLSCLESFSFRSMTSA